MDCFDLTRDKKNAKWFYAVGSGKEWCVVILPKNERKQVEK